MPWMECDRMDEKLRFVARLPDGEKMAPLCQEFNISRKTGYKIFERYKECGLEGLNDRSRKPLRYANQLPFENSCGCWNLLSLWIDYTYASENKLLKLL